MSAEREPVIVRVSGAMFSDRLLKIGEGVHVAVADDAGNEVASGFGRIASATKRERTDRKSVV